MKGELRSRHHPGRPGRPDRSALDRVGRGRAGPSNAIGDIDDMSGLYADVLGPGGVEAIKMAIADFGGTVLGKPIELLTADHQNKPDIGAQKFARMGRPRTA